MKKKTEDLCVLATDFSVVNKHMEDFEKQREKKGNIYHAFSEYILCLENSLEHEHNFVDRCLLQEEIKKMKEEQQKYYVPSILEGVIYNEIRDKRSAHSLEKSSFSLVKQIKNKFNYKNRESGNNNE